MHFQIAPQRLSYLTQGAWVFISLHQSVICPEWVYVCVVTSWTSLGKTRAIFRGRELWVVSFSIQCLQPLTDEYTQCCTWTLGQRLTASARVTFEVAPLLWCVGGCSSIPWRSKSMCKGLKDLRDQFSLEGPAVRCAWDGSVGEVIRDEAERMVVNSLGLGVKQIRVWILTAAYWLCDLKQDTLLFLASVSSSDKWVWQNYLSGLL